MNNWDLVTDLASSYKQNDLGWVLYGLVRACKPKLAVEFGILHGYSTLFIGAALRDNGSGHLLAYDRWPGHLPGIEEEVRQTITQVGLDDWITVQTCDVVSETPFLKNIDFMHVDLDNTAERVEWTLGKYGDKLSPTGVIVFEGGTEERDRLEWVARHGTSIRSIFPLIEPEWERFTLPPFPGMTIIRRKS